MAGPPAPQPGGRPGPVRRPVPTRPPGPGSAAGGGQGGDWRRFLLVRVGAAPLELKPEQQFVIGRNQDCDLPIPSQRVSRRHTEINWKHGRPVIKDLGSQNGTQVNGKRITAEHELKDGDEVVIGPWMCTYRCVSGAGSVGKVVAAADTNAMTQPMVADAMAGNLGQLSLFELLQTLEFNQKTGTLEVFGPDGDGALAIQSGAPVFCRCGQKTGTEAMLDLLLFTAGQFSFKPEIAETERNIQGTTMTSILLEAGRRMDERAGAG